MSRYLANTVKLKTLQRKSTLQGGVDLLLLIESTSPMSKTMGFAATVHVKHPELKTKPRNALNRRGLLCRQRLCEILAIRQGKPLDTPGGASGLGIHWA